MATFFDRWAGLLVVLATATVVAILGRFASDWPTFVAELAIAAVIYYEIEQNRVSHFLDQVQSDKASEDRQLLYDAYTRYTGTLIERAKNLADEIEANETLRRACDRQWIFISRLRYSVSWSLQRRILAKWFPQVVAIFWLMTATYQQRRKGLRPLPMQYGILAVNECLQELLRMEWQHDAIRVRSTDGSQEAEITRAELESLLGDIEAPFASA